MEQSRDGFLYPIIYDKNCVNCGTCKESCPINRSQVERTGKSGMPKAFAVINKNEATRMDSSSGGIFTLLAEVVIAEGGIVFGARFDNDFSIVHNYAEDIEKLADFRGSKYAQSKIDNSYKNAKRFLEEGRKVLFTGTPCQIGGLKVFLNKKYENLICVDIICHGVPSPKVWQKYIEFREKFAGAKTANIAFRRKNYGWMQYSLSFFFKNCSEYSENFKNDLFMKAFLKNLCLRKSCHVCSFKTINRISDITIADFWGIQKIEPGMFDDKGTSLVLLQSLKGQDIFDRIKPNTNFLEVNCKKSLEFNPAAFRSCEEHKKREQFLKNIDKLPFDKLVNKYLKSSFCNMFFKKLKRAVFK